SAWRCSRAGSFRAVLFARRPRETSLLTEETVTETFLAAPSSEGTSRDYWVQRLRGFSQPTPLLDDAAPGRTSQCTAPTSVDLPTSEQGAALRSAVQSLGIQPSSLLEGAWALVASRHQRE